MKEVELTPVDNNSINTTKIFEKNGNRYTYSTSALTPNTNIADAMFVFDAKKYPGVEVVDLR